MFPYVALSKDKAWQPGPYEGVELMILHKHEITGGVVVLRKFKPRHTIPAHTHPNANPLARCSLRPRVSVTVRTSRALKSSASQSLTAR
jgi:hypothetical protein